MNGGHGGGLWGRLWQAPLIEVMWGLLSSSVVCAVLAIAIAGASALVLRRRGVAAPAVGVRQGQMGLRIVGALVAVAWLTDVVLRGYVFDMSETSSWWRFAVASVVSAGGLIVVGSRLRARGPRRSVDAVSVARRTWTTFGPRRGLVVFAALSLVFAGVVVISGAMSDGAAHVALDAPNTALAPVVFSFPGWTYGIPAAIALVALVLAVVFALHRNAIRPYRDGVPRERERVDRLETAREIITIASAAVLLGVAGMLRMVRSAAATSLTFSETGRTATVDMRVPHEDLILVGGQVAPLLEIGGCVLLVLLAFGASGRLAPWGRSSALAAGAAA